MENSAYKLEAARPLADDNISSDGFNWSAYERSGGKLILEAQVSNALGLEFRDGEQIITDQSKLAVALLSQVRKDRFDTGLIRLRGGGSPIDTVTVVIPSGERRQVEPHGMMVRRVQVGELIDPKGEDPMSRWMLDNRLLPE